MSAEIPVLTLHQPWASLIALGVKTGPEPFVLSRGLSGHLWLWTGAEASDIEDQRSYGDFTPGRFAWLLADIVPIDPPVPFKGGQGLSRRTTPDA